MNKYIPDEIIEEIRSSNDIVRVVSDHLRLTKQGRNFIGLCPFHNEKTPSFTVSQEKQIYRCFGCGEGGNVFSFLMKLENLSFPEAARKLADKVGITIPEDTNPEREAKLKELRQAFEINKLVSDFYHYLLLKHEIGDEARKYLKRRGLTSETIEGFQLGFAPPSWDSLTLFMNKKGYSLAKLERLGLIQKRTRGTDGYYDKFRNRVIFPIWNDKSSIVGFGGRVMDDSLPKYLNSPETLLFNKRHLLYGINLAADSIREKNQVIIVEGYLDVITSHQAGVKNVVASLGTAFTEEQGKLLLRYIGVTGEVVIAYDMDAAGIKATMKGWNILYRDMGCSVKVVGIPDGKDPDDFIRNNGPEKFRRLVSEKAQSFDDYTTDRAMVKFDINTLEGKIKAASEVIPIIRTLSNQIEKDEAIMRLSKRLHLSPDAVRTEVEKKSPDSRNNWAKRDKMTGLRHNNNEFVPLEETPTEDRDARSKAEETLLMLVLDDRNLLSKVKAQIGVHFSSKLEYLNIINLLLKMEENKSEYQSAVLFDYIQDEATAKMLGSLIVKELPADNRDQVIMDCLKTIKEDEIRKKREELLKQMEEADKLRDHEMRKKLVLEYSKLI